MMPSIPTVICETCKKAGEKSRVRCLGGSTTAMYCEPFHDEDGKYHHHDMNVVMASYECSNGHAWTTQVHPKCPSCNWPDDEEKKTA